MKKITAILFTLLLLPQLFEGACFTIKAQGLITPPTEDVTVKHYSMGAYVQPEGQELNWDDGYYITMVYSNTTNDVWVSNLFPQYFMDGTSGKDGYNGMYAWIHGTVNDNRITFKNEKVFHYTNPTTLKESDFYIMSVESETGVEVIQKSFDFVIDEAGNIQIDDDTYEPSLYVCLIKLNADGSVPVGSNGVDVEDYGLGYELTYLPEEMTKYPEIPSSVQMKSYTYGVTHAYGGKKEEKSVMMGVEGNDVYVKGLSTIADYNGNVVYPDVVFKGSLAEDGQSFTMPSQQFYGIENYFGVYYITFLYGMEYNSIYQYYDPIDGVTFEKHEDGSWKLKEDGNISCMTNGGVLYELIALATLTPNEDSAVESLTSPLTKGDGAIYNLNGQRTNGLHKGVNIMNGRKVVVK